jgi:hypothetical protein
VNDLEPFYERPNHRDRRAPRREQQRAYQIADDPGFPAPVAEDGRGRLWDRREVKAWAKRWRREKPWR